MKNATVFCAIAAVMSFTITASAQDWASMAPLYGSYDLATDFWPDPVSVSIQAGGSDDAGSVLGAVGCTGNITAAQPDVRLNFVAGAFALKMFVNSAADTTLVVNAPDGTWNCNDDSTGLNPSVVFETPQSGQYDIWIGIWGAADVQPATLVISELDATPLDCSQNAQGLLGETGNVTLGVCPPGCTNATIWGNGIYSDDSSVCTAAIHAGVLTAGQGGVVGVTIADGQAEYPAVEQNGVSSSSWGSWGRSFTVDAGAALTATAVLEVPVEVPVDVPVDIPVDVPVEIPVPVEVPTSVPTTAPTL